jgi:predicted phage terminase large subunit-like protein
MQSPILSPYRKALAKPEYDALEAWFTTFYPFQQRWLADRSDYAICNKSRQIGLSHTSGALGVLWGAFHGETTTIISKGEKESQEVLEKAKKHAQVLGRLGSRMALLTRNRTDEIAFLSGGKVVALPSTGGRGFTGNVILDEFAYHETYDEKVWEAAMAVTMLGCRGRVISTPNGVGNKFAEVWKASGDREFGWSPHSIPIELAIEEGYPVDLKRCWTLAAHNEILFSQLFQCAFVDPEHRFLFKDLPRGKCRYGDRPGGQLRICIGLDFASSKRTAADYSAAVVLAAFGSRYFVLEVLRGHFEPREFRDKIAVLLASYPGAMCGAHVAPTERGSIEFFRESGLPIAGYPASQDKFQRAIPVATAWNQHEIWVPSSSPWGDAFISELSSFTGDEKKDRHDDQVDAFASAFHGLRTSVVDFRFGEELNAIVPKAVTW